MQNKINKYIVVAGSPIAHSKSPAIFNKLINKQKPINIYSRLWLSKLNELFIIQEDLNLYAANVTTPFKTEIFNKLGSQDEATQQIEAINTVIFGEQDLTYNTDYLAVKDIFYRRYAKTDLGANNGKLPYKRALVLGCGSSGRAAAVALKELGFRVTLANRTYQRAIDYAQKRKLHCLEWGNMNTDVFQIVVDTVSENIFKPSDFPRAEYFLHAKYFGENGIDQFNSKVIHPEEWLLSQAYFTADIIEGRTLPRENFESDLDEVIKWDVNAHKNSNIFLFGFMNSGKSTVGKILAKKLGRNFIDVDNEVEKDAGLSVVNIFENYGENYFRTKENETLNRICANLTKSRQKAVISCGGGIMENERNRRLLHQNGYCVWVYRPFDDMMRMMEVARRPVAMTRNKEELFALYNHRKPLYFESSDLILFSASDFERRTLELGNEFK
ncbi:MAG: shikimate kinase [Chloroflexota bacterium]